MYAVKISHSRSFDWFWMSDVLWVYNSLRNRKWNIQSNIIKDTNIVTGINFIK